MTRKEFERRCRQRSMLDVSSLESFVALIRTIVKAELAAEAAADWKPLLGDDEPKQ